MPSTEELITRLTDFRVEVDEKVRLKTAPRSVSNRDHGSLLRKLSLILEDLIETVGTGSGLAPEYLMMDGDTQVAVPDTFLGGEVTGVTWSGVTLYPSDVDDRPGVVTYSVDDEVTVISFSVDGSPATITGPISVTGSMGDVDTIDILTAENGNTFITEEGNTLILE